MHESTVSRVTNEKYVQTPRGVLPLKFFFSSALSTASGEDASARSIRAKLQKMVGEERPREAAHRPADRAPVPGAGHPDRPPHRRQVPRPARHPAGPDAEAGMTHSRRRAGGRQRARPGQGRGGEPSRVRPPLRRGAAARPGSAFEVDRGGRRLARRDRARCSASLRREYPFLRVVTHRRQRGIADALRSAGEVAARRHLRLLSRRPAVPARGHPRPWCARSSTARPTSSPAPSRASTRRPSCRRVYNRLCRWLFGVRVTDLNSVKAYRREVMDDVPLRPDWHRYMVVIAAADGFRLDLAPGAAASARAPASRSSTGRGFRSACSTSSRSGSSSASAGSRCSSSASPARSLFIVGFLAGIVALVLRFGYGIGFRPLLNLVETMVISGIALFGFGFVGEMIAGMREEKREVLAPLARLAKRRPRD